MSARRPSRYGCLMPRLIAEEIEAYAQAHSQPPGELLQRLREETFAKMEHPGMQVGPVEGALLRLLVRLVRARRVIELGTFTGYSALMMAEGLAEDGELFTCEIDPRPLEMARRYFAQSPHGGKIKPLLGPALESLKQLGGPFELAFVDADKQSYPEYYERLVPLLAPGGLFVADNALWGGRVLRPEDEESRAIAQLNERVARDPRVEKVLLTVRDGILLAYKRGAGSD